MADGFDASTDRSRAWAGSGMMYLTGRSEGSALGGPEALVRGGRHLAADIARRSGRLGRPVRVDPLALMVERAAIAGHHRRGQISCGGSSRLLRSADGWIAATMARPTDWELVPALLERAGAVADGAWSVLDAGVSGLEGAELRARAEVLGLPLAVLGERRPPAADTTRTTGLPGTSPGISSRRIRPAPPVGSLPGLVVADLSALWAGPLVGRLLARAGARVIKIESISRVDGARGGDPGFYAAMNAGKASVALDFGDADHRRLLAGIVSRADVVISASRPRALDQLGLDVEALVRGGRPRVWLMISGYGGEGSSSGRVAFGDDAAVAGGLVGWEGTTPCFCGDAVADPLTGLAGTAAVLAALESDGAWVVEASMADIAAGMTGPVLPVEGLHAAPPGPVTPPPASSVSALGQDTARVLAELGMTHTPGSATPGPGGPGSRRAASFGTLRTGD